MDDVPTPRQVVLQWLLAMLMLGGVCAWAGLWFYFVVVEAFLVFTFPLALVTSALHHRRQGKLF
jgi:hypothetical protein